MFARLRHPDRSVGSHLTSWMMLLAYILATFPIPLPMGVVTLSGQPFPCQSHRCGCSSLGQCLNGCCCYSRQQVVAWAKENKVRLPQVVRPTIEKRGCGSGGGGSAKKKQSSCCKSKPKKRQMPAWVVTLEAMKCRGLTPDYMALGEPVSTPPAIVAWQPRFDLVAIISISRPMLSVLPGPPPVPPG